MRPAALLALLVSCKVANELYCDGTTRCPAGYTCELDGGPQQNGCVPIADAGAADSPIVPDAAPPDAILCTDAGGCPDPFPICRAGVCGTCRTDLECPTTEPMCAPSGSCELCTDDAACAGRDNLTHCLTSSGACVQCRNNADCSATTTTPVCDNTLCRACRKDAECAAVAGICDNDMGRCVPGAEILYVQLGGTGLACTAANPCGSIKTALGKVSPSQRWIKISAGAFAESFLVKDQIASIVGAGPTTIIQADGANPVVSVQGTSDLLLRSVRIRDGANANADGIRCEGTAGMTLMRGFDLQIDGNAGRGVYAANCTIRLERSRVLGNLSGGLRFFDSAFIVRNNFIGLNGTVDVSTLGGVDLVSVPDASSIFEFNTVSGNRSRSDVSPGVHCGDSITLSSNIVWGNGVVPDTTVQSVGCTFVNSDIGGPGGAPPNINKNPLFHDAVGGDYHLDAGSPCANAGQSGTGTADDIDGEPRPKGPAPDIGADEAF